MHPRFDHGKFAHTCCLWWTPWQEKENLKLDKKACESQNTKMEHVLINRQHKALRHSFETDENEEQIELTIECGQTIWNHEENMCTCPALYPHYS